MSSYNSDERRFVIETGFVDDEMSVAVTGEGFCFEIDEPWQGDTESGFGARCSVDIDFDTAEALHEWLGNVLAGRRAQEPESR